MCGIVGVLSGNKYGFISKDHDVFKQLLICDTLRGAHSTGVFVGVRGKESGVGWVKSVGTGADMVFSKDYDDICGKNFLRYGLAVGHNRYATSGKISTNNSHPFSVGNITLVHNGTIRGVNGLEKYYKYDVDSHKVCAKLNDLSIEEGYDFIKELAGAFAFVWKDTRNDTINIIRNNERPLYYCKSKGHSSLYFASEEGMLRWILDRNDVKYEEILQFEENVLHVFKETSLEPEKITLTPVINTYSCNVMRFPKRYDHSSDDYEDSLYDYYRNGEEDSDTTYIKFDSHEIKQKKTIYFIVEDIVPYKGNNFCRVVGKRLTKDNLIICGNTVLDMDVLTNPDTILKAEIANKRRGGKNSPDIYIDVKNIEVSMIKPAKKKIEDGSVVAGGKCQNCEMNAVFNTSCSVCGKDTPPLTIENISI